MRKTLIFKPSAYDTHIPVDLTLLAGKVRSDRFKAQSEIMTPTDLLVATLVLLWIYFLWSRRRYYKAFLQLPGPLGFPLLGVALKIMKPESEYVQNNM